MCRGRGGAFSRYDQLFLQQLIEEFLNAGSRGLLRPFKIVAQPLNDGVWSETSLNETPDVRSGAVEAEVIPRLHIDDDDFVIENFANDVRRDLMPGCSQHVYNHPPRVTIRQPNPSVPRAPGNVHRHSVPKWSPIGTSTLLQYGLYTYCGRRYLERLSDAKEKLARRLAWALVQLESVVSTD